MTLAHKVPRQKKKLEKIPSYLVYETLNGKIMPYKGYKDVLAKKEKTSEIMGSSGLQGILVGIIYGFIFNSINRKKYLIGTNELGVYISKNTNLATDIVIFEREGITLDNRYITSSPKVVIEIDFRIDIAPDNHDNDSMYVIEKSQKLLDFGAEKVIWLMTHTKTIFVFSKTEIWTIVPFNTDIPVLDDCVLNVAKLMEEEGIEVP